MIVGAATYHSKGCYKEHDGFHPVLHLSWLTLGEVVGL